VARIYGCAMLRPLGDGRWELAIDEPIVRRGQSDEGVRVWPVSTIAEAESALREAAALLGVPAK
jgi:hypothetical protein